MLSIAAMGSGSGNYYMGLATEDYYLKGGEPEGHWFGLGAARLGLPEIVTSRDFQNLFRGFSPADKPLVQNAGMGNRQPGWDLTFSAPKSLSVLWSVSPKDEQLAIQACQVAAVKAALSYLESEWGISRSGKGGTNRVAVGLAVAMFEHGTSRALDPQLHTHALILNLGVSDDGRVRTLVSKSFYEAKMTAGAIYRLELATRLRDRGYSLVDHRTWFEVEGVPEELRAQQSKRRTMVEDLLRAKGLDSAAAAAFATLESRAAKDISPPRQLLFTRWRDEANEMGFGYENIRRSSGEIPRSVERTFRDVIRSARELADTEGHFTAKDLLRRTAERIQTSATNAATLREAVHHALTESKSIVRLGELHRQTHFTTKEMIDIERRMLDRVSALSALPFKPLSKATVERCIERDRLPAEKPSKDETPIAHVVRHIRRSLSQNTFTLNEEQAQAIRYLTQAPGRIKCVQGYAGTGKTTMLLAAREAFEKVGYRMLGCTLAANAAKTLEHETGIASETLKMRFMQLSPDASQVAKHEVKQMFRAFRGKDRYDYEKLSLDRKTVVVLDEASMVSTRDFARLVGAVEKAGAILVCIGDTRQLPAIDAGGGFAAICKRVGQVELSSISRQRNELDREAVKDLAHGRVEKVLTHYAQSGCLTISDSRSEAQAALVMLWQRNGGIERPHEHVIYSGSKEQVAEFNRLAQAKRLSAGTIDAASFVQCGDQKLHVGDRVICLKNSRALGVQNGSIGVVTGIKDFLGRKTIAIKLDREKLHVLIPLKSYNDLSLAYSFTTHKAQGSTVENAYVLLGERMTSRELSYVQASRHKGTLQLFTTRHELGLGYKTPTEFSTERRFTRTTPLEKDMSRSNAKVLAQDLVGRHN